MKQGSPSYISCILTNNRLEKFASPAESNSSASVLPKGVIALGKWHAKLPEFSLTVASAKSTSDVYSINVDSMQVERWTRSELGGVSANKLVEPKLIRWQSFDDREITGFYYPSPTDFPGNVQLSSTSMVGPKAKHARQFLGRNNYFMSELGVAMIYPNVRGSAGFGKSYVN